jgi:hypothetical protein
MRMRRCGIVGAHRDSNGGRNEELGAAVQESKTEVEVERMIGEGTRRRRGACLTRYRVLVFHCPLPRLVQIVYGHLGHLFHVSSTGSLKESNAIYRTR